MSGTGTIYESYALYTQEKFIVPKEKQWRKNSYKRNNIPTRKALWTLKVETAHRSNISHEVRLLRFYDL